MAIVSNKRKFLFLFTEKETDFGIASFFLYNYRRTRDFLYKNS